MPLDISSRSESVNANRERRRGAGRIPPCGANWKYIDDDGLPNARPIALSDSPRCQRSHNSVFSAAVKPRGYPCHIAKHSIFSVKDKVLRRYVETTSKSGQTRARLDCPLSAMCGRLRVGNDFLHVS